MTDQRVFCSKIGCSSEAAALLLIAPGDTQAWLLALDHPDGREGVLLCDTHAERVTVPKGWSLEDERALARSTKRRRKKTKSKKTDEPLADETGDSTANEDESTKPANDPAKDTAAKETTEKKSAAKAESLEPVAADEIAAPPEDPAAQDGLVEDDGADDPTLVNQAIVVPVESNDEVAETDPTRELTLAIPGDPGVAADEAVGRHLRPSDEAPTGRDAVLADTSEGEETDEEIDLVAEDDRALSVVPVQEDELPFDEADASVTETGSHLITTESTPLLKRAFRVVEEG